MKMKKDAFVWVAGSAITVALMMRWASVTQSNGRYMCSGSHGGGRGMGLVYDLRLPLEFSYECKKSWIPLSA